MIKVKVNQLSLNDVLYDTGDVYSSHHELKKVIIKSIRLNENHNIVINDYYILYKSLNDEYWYDRQLYFSEKKAINVINDYIKQQNKRKEKYEKEQEIKRQYEQQIIDNKLGEKYLDKPIMIYRGKDGWVKTKCINIFATDNGIYLTPNYCGHICKLSREGNTWKMWSELEELEEQKKKLEERINILRGKDNVED